MAAIQADCDSRSDFIGKKMAAALLGLLIDVLRGVAFLAVARYRPKANSWPCNGGLKVVVN